MGLRDDLIGVVDEVRGDVIDTEAGLRLFAVKTRTRTWSGGEVGRGTAIDVETPLTPKPRVRAPAPHHVLAAPGRYEDGDRIVDRISATYTEAELDGGTLTTAKEFYWLIDSEPYRVIGKPEKRYLEWRVQLRRMLGR